MHLDTNIIKLKDPRVQELLRGVGSLQLLGRTLKYPDWLLVHHNKLTAIPQYQFATLLPAGSHALSDALFQQYLHDTQLYQKLSDAERVRIDDIKKALQSCPVCKRASYKQQFRQIIIKYIELPKSQLQLASQYPDTAVQLPPVFTQATKPLKQTINRHACYDCIQKHVGQASITALEAQLGYPQHILLCYGHLAQAIQECPADAVHLKALLTLCLGISKMYGEGFVPLQLLSAAVQQCRAQDQGSQATKNNVQDTRYTLQHNITDELLRAMSDTDIQKLYLRIKLFIEICANLRRLVTSDIHEYRQMRLKWLGIMANISELLLAYQKDSANAIRNIRLMFYAAPQLICDLADYNMKDVMALLEQQLATRGLGSSRPDTTASDALDDA